MMDGRERSPTVEGVAVVVVAIIDLSIGWARRSAANRAVVDVTNWPESPRRASEVIDEVRCQVYLR